MALVVTQDEDFGIAAVEVQSCGRPAIVLSSSGAEEAILPGKTGVIYDKQNTQSLKDAIMRASELKWNVPKIRQNSLQYSKAVFVKSLTYAINNYVHERSKP